MNQGQVHPGAAQDETGDKAEDTVGDRVTTWTWGPSGKLCQRTGAGESGASRVRLVRAIKTYCWQHTDSIHSGHSDQLYSSILWKVHLLFLSFPLKLHSCAYGKKKKKWKCTLKRCIKSSTRFLCLVMFCLSTSLWKDLASLFFLLFWGRGFLSLGKNEK